MFKSSYLVIFVIILLSCSNSSSVKQLPEQTLDTPAQSSTTQNEAQNTANSGLDLTQYRSSLSDTYSKKENTIPLAYSRIKLKGDDDEQDMFEGYRVQIYSGQNVALADTIASIFRTWSDITIMGYQAETYTFFKAPYYRVHIGDFHKKDQAIYFSNLIKRRFRDAWVVYDRIDPWHVPSDTTFIYTK